MTAPGRPMVVVCDWATIGPRRCILGRRERAYARALTGRRRREWATCRTTARAALCWATGGPARDVLPDGDGRPVAYGARPAGTPISLAHTGTVAACVVGGARTGPVGIDVEPVHPDNELLLPRIGTRQELSALDALPARDRATALVCAKEAALKAYGKRFSSLRAYPVSRDATGRLWVSAPGGPPLSLSILAIRDHVAAVCAASPVPPRVWLARPHALLRLVRATAARRGRTPPGPSVGRAAPAVGGRPA